MRRKVFLAAFFLMLLFLCWGVASADSKVYTRDITYGGDTITVSQEGGDFQLFDITISDPYLVPLGSGGQTYVIKLGISAYSGKPITVTSNGKAITKICLAIVGAIDKDKNTSVTLQDLNIDMSNTGQYSVAADGELYFRNGEPAVEIASFADYGQHVALTLKGKNTLKGGVSRAGLEKVAGHQDSTLTITGKDTDVLTAVGGWGGAGIGGRDGNRGTQKAGTNNITINGGHIIASAGATDTTRDGVYASGAGIGGGAEGSATGITIAGSAVVEATGEGGGAGIGGGTGGYAKTILVSENAKVTAKGGTGGAGIGNGSEAASRASGITIKGAVTVDATGEGGGAGIGGGTGSAAEGIFIQGGTVNAVSQRVDIGKASESGGAGIGGGHYRQGQKDGQYVNHTEYIDISGGNVTARGDGGAGIGGGSMKDHGAPVAESVSHITIGGTATVNASSTNNGAGIGGGCNGLIFEEGAITIQQSANVRATGGSGAAGIGGGDVSNDEGAISQVFYCGGIHITGAEVNARGGSGAAGIGGGRGTGINIRSGKEDCPSILIAEDANVTAQGDGGGAGIGAGDGGKVRGVIKIKRATIDARGGSGGAGVGAGMNGEVSVGSGKILFEGVSGRSRGESGGAGVGSGRGETLESQNNMEGWISFTGDNDFIASGDFGGAGIGAGYQGESEEYSEGYSGIFIGGTGTVTANASDARQDTLSWSGAVGHGAGVVNDKIHTRLMGDCVLYLNLNATGLEARRGILAQGTVAEVHGAVALRKDLILPPAIRLLIGEAKDGTPITNSSLDILTGVTMSVPGRLTVGQASKLTVGGALKCGLSTDLAGYCQVQSGGVLENAGEFTVQSGAPSGGKLLIWGTLKNLAGGGITGKAMSGEDFSSKYGRIGVTGPSQEEGVTAAVYNQGRMVMEEQEPVNKNLEFYGEEFDSWKMIYAQHKDAAFTGNAIIYLSPLKVTDTGTGNPISAGADYSQSADSKRLTIFSDRAMTISGYSITDQLVIDSKKGANLTLNSVVVDMRQRTDGVPALLITKDTGAVDITLRGSSRLAGGADCAALQKETTGVGALLTIKGDGALNAQGGAGGAGIGGARSQQATEITVTESAQVTATGGAGGAGIGGGQKGSTLGITVNGSAQVTATGGDGAAGIGGGEGSWAQSITVDGQAQVVARGGSGAAGIGSSKEGGYQAISVAGSATVEATGGAGGQGIGGTGTSKPQNPQQGDVYVSISENAFVKVDGGEGAWAVGAGTLDGAGAVLIASADTGLTKTLGVSIENGHGEVYGKVTLARDLAIEKGWTLYAVNDISEGKDVVKQLTVPSGVTVTNSGKVCAWPGSAQNLADSSGAIVVADGGHWKGNPPVFEEVVGKNVGAFLVTGEVNREYYYENGALVVRKGAKITIANIDPTTPTTDRIVVDENASATITLAGVNIDTTENGAPSLQIDMNGPGGTASSGDVTIILAEGTENRLINKMFAALQKGAGEGKLTITGDGALEARSKGLCAAIGGGYNQSTANIEIAGGTIYAEAWQGAAIGSGREGTATNIVISGGNVTAAGDVGAGIGSGYGADGQVLISGGTVNATSHIGAAIGGGQCAYGQVTITGGKVSAAGGAGAGIGSGSRVKGGDRSSSVTITAGEVDAQGAQGIGNGGNQDKTDPPGLCAIEITGGTVTARGGQRALDQAPENADALAAEAGKYKDGIQDLVPYVPADNDKYRYVRIEGTVIDTGKEISAAAVTSVAAPAAGELPDWANQTPQDALYTAYRTEWEPDSYTFGYATAYTASVTLEAVFPNWFADSATGTINGDPATAVLNADGTLTLSYTFPATAPAPVTGPDFDGAIRDIENAPEGGTVTLDMRGQTVLPARVLRALAGRDVTLFLLMDGGIRWEIKGLNVPADLPDVDLGAMLGGQDIPQEVVNALAAGNETLQLRLYHTGPFGFTAQLWLPVQAKLEGEWGLLYRYENGQMAYQGAKQVQLDGGKHYLKYQRDHASDYLIVFRDAPPEAPAIETKELPSARVGKKYDAKLQAKGEDLQWSLVRGELPQGLSLASGRIEGTAEREGTYEFALRAENAYGADERELQIKVLPEERTRRLTLNADYLLLSVGQEAQLTIAGDEFDDLPVTWLAEGDEGVLSVAADGTVKALARGLGYAVAEVDYAGEALKARCRIDVIEGTASQEVEGAVLGAKSVSVKLYRQERSRFEVSLTLPQNMAAKSAEPMGSILGARFADEKTAKRFALHVLDDRTLEVEPVQGITIKMDSYQSAVILSLHGGGEVKTKAKLTIKVDRTLPEVKGKLAFNSFYENPVQTLQLEGAEVKALKVVSCPEGVIFDPATMRASLTGKLPKSAKLKLEAELEGWTKPVDVSVPVSSKSTPPKVRFSEDGLILDQKNEVGVACEGQIEDVQVAPWKDLSKNQRKSYKLNEEDEYGFAAAYANEKVTIQASKPADGKLLLAVTVAGGREPVYAALNIQARADGLKLKQKGAVDVLRPESEVILTPTMKGKTRKVWITAKDAKKKDKGEWTDQFEIEERADGSFSVRKAKGAELNPDYLYRFWLTADVNGGEQTTKLTFAVKKGKATAKASAKSATLFANDRHSEAVLEIRLAEDDLPAIEKVTTSSKRYEAEYLGDGAVRIAFKDGKATSKEETIKLKVYVKGCNQSAASVKVKVTVAK